MDLTLCPKCRTRVVPKRDGTCPACQQSFVVAEADPSVLGGQPQRGAGDDAVSTAMSRLQAPRREKRPTGLSILAVIQFLFAASLAYAFYLLAAGVLPGENMTPYRILSPSITFALLVASAQGYLTRSRPWGFWGGNLLGVGSILNILAYNASEGFVQFPRHVPSLVYPVVLLGLLNFRYRNEFR